jgi:beta-glucosidase
MPWIDKVKAVVAAFYPGQAGGRAIAEVLTGKVNPSGRLPVTFPVSEDQLPHPTLPHVGAEMFTPITVDYHEGAEVGYRWFAQQGVKPLFSFGHGLSYTTFTCEDFSLAPAPHWTARCVIRNTGERAGANVAQVYLTAFEGAPRARLLGFARVQLEPGEAADVTIALDPRLLATYDEARRQWVIGKGVYEISLSEAADAPRQTRRVTLSEARWRDGEQP